MPYSIVSPIRSLLQQPDELSSENLEIVSEETASVKPSVCNLLQKRPVSLLAAADIFWVGERNRHMAMARMPITRDRNLSKMTSEEIQDAGRWIRHGRNIYVFLLDNRHKVEHFLPCSVHNPISNNVTTTTSSKVYKTLKYMTFQSQNKAEGTCTEDLMQARRDQTIGED